VNNFAGGDGSNYYASLTTYADAGAAGSGAVSTTPASTYNYNNQPNGTRYIKLVSGSRSDVKQIGQTFNFNANYSELVGYIYTCNSGVTSTPVYKNTNTCFFGNQWIAGTTTYATNPSQTAPNTDPVWVNRDINTYWVCVGVNKYYQQINTNICSTTYNQTQTGSIYEPNSFDCGYTTTTTTTTLPPVNCSISSVCDGSFQDITISGFTGGNGSYLASTTTYDSASNAFSGSFEAVSGSKFYNNQPGNSIRYIVLKDTDGRSVLKSINADCATTTTTTSTTTSTTTAAPYDIFFMTEYICDNGSCVATGEQKYGAFPVGFSANPIRYYRPATPTGFAYTVGSRFQSGSPAIIMSSTSFISCATAAGC
jgi:hypothetical protein